MGRTFVELLEEQLGQARARCEHLQAENARLQKALEGCIHEFADITNGELRTGGISCLEEACKALGWDYPHPAPPELLCDVPGCGNAFTEWRLDGNVRRQTCDKHMPKQIGHIAQWRAAAEAMKGADDVHADQPEAD